MSISFKRLAMLLGRNLPVDDELRTLLGASDLCIIPALMQYFKNNKVLPQAFHNVKILSVEDRSPLGFGLVEALSKDYTKIADRVSNFFPRMKTEVTRLLTEACIQHMFIKGGALAAYPHGHLRHQNDLDLLVDNWDDMIRAVQILRAHGFDYDLTDGPWIVLTEMKGMPKAIGHFSLTWQLAEQSGSIDIHAMPFLIAQGAFFNSAIWSRAYHKQYNRIPSIEDKLLFMLAHVISHGYVLQRDYNDAYALLVQNTSTLDWNYIDQVVRDNALGAPLYYILQQVDHYYASGLVPPAIRDRLPHEWLLEQALRLTLRWQSRRPHLASILTHTPYLVARESRQRTWRVGLTSAAKNIVWQLRDMMQDRLEGHWAFVDKILHKIIHPKNFEMKRGEQFMLVPVELILDEKLPVLNLGGLAWQTRLNATGLSFILVNNTIGLLSLNGTYMVVTEAGVYVATHDAYFSKQDMEQLARYFNCLSSCVFLIA